MIWANLLHIYQPPNQTKKILKKVTVESYSRIIKILKFRPQAKITLNINASLTEQLVAHELNEVIEDIKSLAERGQIEFTASAKYHTFFPLLPKEEIIRQIQLNYEVNQKFIGKFYCPQGIFLPELGYSRQVAEIIQGLGFKWIVLDEIGYGGKLGQVDFNQAYSIKGLKLKVVFRNREVSDLFFTAKAQTVNDFFKVVEKTNRGSQYLITALDGENLGHHKKGMDILFANVLDSPKIQTLFYSELLSAFKKTKEVDPLPCSWSSQEDEMKNSIPYALWKNPQNSIHKLQWELVNLVIETISKVSEKDPGFKKARTLLDRSLNSDPYWWASANPWWSVKIINQGAKRLIDILKAPKTISVEAKERAKDLYKQIISLAKEWQESGRAEKIRKAFLAGQPYERFFGGKKIN